MLEDGRKAPAVTASVLPGVASSFVVVRHRPFWSVFVRIVTC